MRKSCCTDTTLAQPDSDADARANKAPVVGFKMHWESFQTPVGTLKEALEEIRILLIVVAIVASPYLCYSLSRAGEIQKLLEQSRATGTVLLTGPPTKSDRCHAVQPY
jgi:hypothetical protein